MSVRNAAELRVYSYQAGLPLFFRKSFEGLQDQVCDITGSLLLVSASLFPFHTHILLLT